MVWGPLQGGQLDLGFPGLQNCLKLEAARKEMRRCGRGREGGREGKTLMCTYVYTCPCILTRRQGFTPDWGKHVQGAFPPVG